MKAALVTLAWMVAGVMALASAAVAAQGGLTPEQVKRWMEKRIELTRIQRDMAANAADYDDLPRAFALQSRRYLNASGYGADRYAEHKERIRAAESALTQRQQLEADIVALEAAAAGGDPLTDPKNRKIINDLRAAGLPESEVQAVIERMRISPAGAAELQARADKQRAWLDNTRRDWDGVRPWLDALDQLTSWYAGNRAQPPDLPHPD